MNNLFLALLIFILSGLVSLVFYRMNRCSSVIGIAGVLAGCVFGLLSALDVLVNENNLTLVLNWMPYLGDFSIGIDPLSAFFLVPVFIITPFIALYGGEYISQWSGKKNIGNTWFFFNILVASVVLVIISRNFILFLIAWEIMTVSSFILVLFEYEKSEVRYGGFLYLIIAHIGVVSLIVTFILLGKYSGSLNFSGGYKLNEIISSIIFILALFGFGTKIGIIPFHVWLPEAYPAAPAHVSAFMSGVMKNAGVYGFLRIISMIGYPLYWWGWVLIFIGCITGIFGIMMALTQKDLRRLLSYSSVENAGIIIIGIGIGILGISFNKPILIVLGFSAGLIHAVNHLLLKTLLFLSVGGVLKSTGTTNMNSLGGILKKMPYTGFCFLFGAIAISGIPPFNGFIGEFMLYYGALKGIGMEFSICITLLLVIICLGLISALAMGTFTKAFGMVFLGNPRTEISKRAKESGFLMQMPVIFITVVCLMLCLGADKIFSVLNNILVQLCRLSSLEISANLNQASLIFKNIVFSEMVLIGIILFIFVIRRILVKGKTNVTESFTWDCGYINPTPKMQYTSSSFVQPITDFFKSFLKPRINTTPIKNIFPVKKSFEVEVPDIFLEKFYKVIAKTLLEKIMRFRWIQQGQMQLYMFYIVLTLIILLLWKI